MAETTNPRAGKPRPQTIKTLEQDIKRLMGKIEETADLLHKYRMDRQAADAQRLALIAAQNVQTAAQGATAGTGGNGQTRSRTRTGARKRTNPQPAMAGATSEEER